MKEMYKFDTHVHCSETSPCARVPGGETARLYSRAGYQGLVVTDHYEGDFFGRLAGLSWEAKAEAFLRGYRACREEGERLGLTVLLGMEIRLNQGPEDYLVFGLREELLLDRPELFRLSLKELAALAERENLLIYQAHPFRKGLSRAPAALLHGMEAYNGNKRSDSRNEEALRYAEETGSPCSSGSDFHWEEDLGRGGLLLPRPVETNADLREYLRGEPRPTLIAEGAPVLRERPD